MFNQRHTDVVVMVECTDFLDVAHSATINYVHLLSRLPHKIFSDVRSKMKFQDGKAVLPKLRHLGFVSSFHRG